MTKQAKPDHKLRLGVNIDHVATIRNARGGAHPDPLQAAHIAAKAGADGITAHLREDRRHIRDADIAQLMEALDLPLNLEMAATEEMLAIALQYKPHACCLVPEKRQELTTEGGLDVAAQQQTLAPFIARLADAGIRVSLFIDPDRAQIEAARACQAAVVELHTGSFCAAHTCTQMIQDTQAEQAAQAAQTAQKELTRLAQAAEIAHNIGLEVHAGHGLDFATVKPIAALPQIVELNIGHFLIGAAIYTGLADAVAKMRRLMDDARPTQQDTRPMQQTEQSGEGA